MDRIEIEIVSAARFNLELRSFPGLASENRLVNKGLDILRKYLPKLMGYIAKQRVLGRMPACRITVRTREKTDLDQARHLLKHWLGRKKNRRLFYVAVELVLMPFSAFIAILPGPNVVFYLLFVLFYFHLKAYLSLRKIDINKLDVTLETI